MNLFERVLKAQEDIISGLGLVNPGDLKEKAYERARRMLLSEPTLKALVPGELRDCRTLAHLGQTLEGAGWSSFGSQRAQVWEWFVPLLNKAEFDENSLADADRTVSTAADATGAPRNSGRAERQENTNIFIGHGHSLLWRTLKDFIADDLKLPWDEFNREPTPGISTSERLRTMLQKARFAFLVMTGEDERSGGTLHARDNVVHEIGLFQGKLGFERAIVVLEQGCERFSNIDGLTYIGFPKGHVEACFEQVRKVLRREGLIS